MLNKTVPVENVKLVRTIPFKKNNMLCLIKTHNSLHGIGPIKDKSQIEHKTDRIILDQLIDQVS